MVHDAERRAAGVDELLISWGRADGRDGLSLWVLRGLHGVYDGTLVVYWYSIVHSGRHALFGVLGDVESGRALGDGVEATAETSC